jgi:hypothetical protein
MPWQNNAYERSTHDFTHYDTTVPNSRRIEDRVGCCASQWGAAYLLVIVQDDDHIGVHEAGMVHSLVSHTSRDRSISNDSNRMI